MRVPQVKERVKESPASALRAMFAGIGSMLFVKDKIRHKAGTENSAPETEAAAPETTVAPETVVAETSAAPEVTTAPETTAVPEATVAPETAAAPETVAAPTVVAETTAVPETTAEAAALPLPNYDELTIASLRARLRTLTPEQLTVLIEYERAHANRADVITMFERRITKLALGLTQALPKVTE
jgi:cytoskeletal protein RodZ